MRYVDINNQYKIREDGVIIETITKNIIPTYINSAGYKYLSVSNLYDTEKERAIHRLVYKYFINSEIEDGFVIDHIDGCRTNNHYTNLQKLTFSQNSLKKEGYSVKALFNIKTKEMFLTDNLHKFAKINNIDSSSLYKSINSLKQNHCNYWIVKTVNYSIELDSIVKVGDNHPIFSSLKDLFKGSEINIKRNSPDTVILGTSDDGEIFLANNRKIIMEKYNMTHSGIQDVLRGKSKKHRGFSMKYYYDISLSKDSIITFKNEYEFNDYLERE
jgi:hypothetical protein